MTYCVAMKLDTGLVFASDSRTNAGIDHISRFDKMRVFSTPGERVIVTLSAGNLSVTQNTLNLLDRRAQQNPDSPTLRNVASLYDVAELIGTTMREIKNRDAEYLRQNNIDASASFIVGGQIAGEPLRLFRIYAEGNFIEAGADTPYFQTGETKYGKPIIDRVITRSTPLADATKCVLVSFDSTMRSNLSVVVPTLLIYYEPDTLEIQRRRRFDHGDPYFTALSHEWSEGTRQVFRQLPELLW